MLKRVLDTISACWILQIKNRKPSFPFYRNVRLLVATTSNTILEHLKLEI